MTDAAEKSFSKQDGIRMVLRDYRFFHDCLLDRTTPGDDRFLELHQPLMPELGREVDRARRLMAMHQEADRRKVSVVCPNCSERLRVGMEEASEDLVCHSCQSTFRITGDKAHAATTTDGSRFSIGSRADGLLPGGYLGEFQLEKAIGRGAFGEVWRARDTTLNRLVAVKVLTRLTVDDKVRFQREAEAAARLQHSNIVEVHRAGELEGRLCIVSRFIKGTSLRDIFHNKSIVSPEQAAEWCCKIADALDHAHQAKIVHRDVKPENILLDTKGQPFLTDFGLARDLSRETVMTQDQAVLGSPAYMSPQQAAGESRDLDARTDVYSLGVVLYELLTGFRPFRGSNVQSLIHQIIEDEPVPARRENVNVPLDLDTICTKCLQKRPEDRYATAGDLAADLQRFLNNEPIAARPIGPVFRLWRWCQRKPALAGTISAATLIVLGTVATAFSLITSAYFREQAAHLTAEERREETIEWLNLAHNSLGSSYLQLGELFSLFPSMKVAYAGFLTEGARQYERLAAVKSDDPELETERARVLLILGDIRLELGQTEQALIAYQSARSALASIQAGSDQDAITIELANCDVRLASVSIRKGDVQQAEGQLKGAVSVLEKLTNVAPDRSYNRYSLASALLNYGALLLDSGRAGQSTKPLSEAVEQFQQLVEASPKDSDFLTGLVKSLTLLGQSAIGTGAHDEAIVRMTQGLELLQQREGDFLHNVPVLETRASSHVYLAQALTVSGRSELALSEYRRSVDSWLRLSELAPEVPRYIENHVLRQIDLAQALHDAGRINEALKVLEPTLARIDEMLDRDTSSRTWVYARGLCLDSFGRVLNDLGDHKVAQQYSAAACNAFEFLTEAYPNETDYQMRLGIALRHQGQSSFLLGNSTEAQQSIAKADELFQQLLAEAPAWHLVREQTAFNSRDRALIAELTNSTELATEACGTAIQQWAVLCDQSPSPRFRMNFAWCLIEAPTIELRDGRRAVEIAQALHDEIPSDPSYTALLGAALTIAGQSDEAVRLLNELTKQHPKRHSRDWFYLALARFQLNGDEAVDAFRTACEVMEQEAPANPWLRRLRKEVANLQGIPSR